MPHIDETSYGAHNFTVDWWRELPEAFRVADRVQGETLSPTWDGLNRDPRFITGFDGWDRANTSDKNPYVASVSFTRTFTPTPNVPVLIRSWHTPLIQGSVVLSRVRVTHTVRDYTGAVVASTQAMVETEKGSVDTWVTPDRFGRITVIVDVAIETAGTGGLEPEITEQDSIYTVPGMTMTSPGVYAGGDRTKVTMVELGHYQVETQRVGDATQATMDMVSAIHVGTRDVAFYELPDLASFTINKPYPLLRFMDGVGHQAGFLDDQLAHMWDGETFDPVTAPEQWLRFLGTIMGLPRTYMGRLTLAQLRSHLVAFAENGRPPIGSRRNIAEVAKQWLTGDKQVSVIPATQLPSWNGGEDKALLTAVKGAAASGRVIIAPTAPTPDVEYVWSGTPGASQSLQYTGGTKTGENLETNPKFDNGLTGWSVTNGTLKRDTVTTNTGTGSAQILPGPDTNWYFISDYRRYQFTGTATTTFWVRSTTNAAVYPAAWGYDGAGYRTGPAVTMQPGVWTPVSITYPVSTDYRYRVGLRPAPTSNPVEVMWVDRVHTARERYNQGTYLDGDNTDSSTNDVWVKPGSPNTVYVWDQQARWVQKTGVTQGLIDAVVDAKRGVRSVYTLLMFVRADELPRRDLKSFQTFMQDSGVIPAGHRLVCLESRSTWDQWENAVGPTWRDLETRTKTWTDSESAGVNLDF